MSDDLLERELTAAMTRRAGVAAPRPPSFDDVEGRAARHRQRRTNNARLVGVAAVLLLVVGTVAAAGLRDRTTDVIVGPADDAVDGSAASGERWAVLTDVPLSTADVPDETVSGAGAEVETMDVRPYLLVAPSDEDHDIILGLAGDRWSVNRAHFAPDGYGASATTAVIRGSWFDPSGFTLVPNTANFFRPAASGELDPAAGVPNPFLGATPEELLDAPESHPVSPTVEHLGGRDWVVLPQTCSDSGDSCRSVAVGGDADLVVFVEVIAPAAFDLRQHLTTLELRPGDALERPPGAPDPELDPTLDGPASTDPGMLLLGYGSFLTVIAPPPPDDSVWPAEVPTDYCEAYRQWKEIQILHLGSFGTAGWIRWVETLDAMAPPEVGDAYGILAAEQSAGHDTSATDPGRDALTAVVNDGDARCPG